LLTIYFNKIWKIKKELLPWQLYLHHHILFFVAILYSLIFVLLKYYFHIPIIKSSCPVTLCSHRVILPVSTNSDTVNYWLHCKMISCLFKTCLRKEKHGSEVSDGTTNQTNRLSHQQRQNSTVNIFNIQLYTFIITFGKHKFIQKIKKWRQEYKNTKYDHDKFYDLRTYCIKLIISFEFNIINFSHCSFEI
jgi:hypothetical protein